ncbi:glutamate-cysteine ligase family protein [Mangrovivirga sp. M17]|uniref:Glutamate-cysteine ligase family protein n=1 Tax=Mangrovivirga halotolerans TaxID=2993936 RepID=A0ABT3RPU3_9BACT|nr:glutamate-cysteine ligase family protein [Mangrovivirga halotolerans]MCX2743185.1 glutamate-cysteine ligase family protein [Mangrovivirga halotolerans]
MIKKNRLRLFQAFGVELEYMIVNRDTLEVMPIADKLFSKKGNVVVGEKNNGIISWSNELVMHVLELKTTRPEEDLNLLKEEFRNNIKEINERLLDYNAMLMPTAAHPLMDPVVEKKLWPYDSGEVYQRYDEVFNCSGHGWANLQSTHLNLPFYDDFEFARLHGAIRIILPLLPALAASSPFFDGQFSGVMDNRLIYYMKNQKRIPCITGKVIPERVYSETNYKRKIFDKISEKIASFNEDNILDPVWVNSRGAIARFDRGSIEIRVLDIQECPSADLAILSFIIGMIKLISEERYAGLQKIQQKNTIDLYRIFKQTVGFGRAAVINDSDYLGFFGLRGVEDSTVNDLLNHIFMELQEDYPGLILPWKNNIDILINQGSLSERIIKNVGTNPTKLELMSLYKTLSTCLIEDKMFIKCPG